FLISTEFNELQHSIEPADDSELSLAFNALNFPIGFLEHTSIAGGTSGGEAELSAP
ncbi:hypothetical protein A2U01_0058937, partial [Trifolium medium]|nr:hypothetical protein [Trifolium medium]